jgi:hypothetical protein
MLPSCTVIIPAYNEGKSSISNFASVLQIVISKHIQILLLTMEVKMILGIDAESKG